MRARHRHHRGDGHASAVEAARHRARPHHRAEPLARPVVPGGRERHRRQGAGRVREPDGLRRRRPRPHRARGFVRRRARGRSRRAVRQQRRAVPAVAGGLDGARPRPPHARRLREHRHRHHTGRHGARCAGGRGDERGLAAAVLRRPRRSRLPADHVRRWWCRLAAVGAAPRRRHGRPGAPPGTVELHQRPRRRAAGPGRDRRLLAGRPAGFLVAAELHEPHQPNHRLLAARTASLVDFHTRNAPFFAAFDSKDLTP